MITRFNKMKGQLSVFWSRPLVCGTRRWLWAAWVQRGVTRRPSGDREAAAESKLWKWAGPLLHTSPSRPQGSPKAMSPAYPSLPPLCFFLSENQKLRVGQQDGSAVRALLTRLTTCVGPLWPMWWRTTPWTLSSDLQTQHDTCTNTLTRACTQTHIHSMFLKITVERAGYDGTRL